MDYLVLVLPLYSLPHCLCKLSMGTLVSVRGVDNSELEEDAGIVNRREKEKDYLSADTRWWAVS